MDIPVLAAMQQLGYTIVTRANELNIIGVRTDNAVPNQFDDVIHVVFTDDTGQWKILSFAATTDPGAYWLKKLMNPKGTAILKPGQYRNSHRIGLHRGKYEALVQQNPVTVWRDVNRDNRLDHTNGTEETGLFGINIHRAHPAGVTVDVNDHSAGCQVLASIADFNQLMALARKHRSLYGNNFTYTLLDKRDAKL